jgi:hypothetical protein
MGASSNPGSGTLLITDSTLTANTAQGGDGGPGGTQGGSGFGGAVFNLDGTVTLNDDTLAANTVSSGAGTNTGGADGGAVYNLAFGANIDTGGTTSATLTLNNSILSNSAGGTDLAGQIMNFDPNNNAASVGGSTNLVQTNNLGSTPLAAGVITVTANPNLGPLQNNGGPTFTMALTLTSPAFGAGNPNVSGLPATDQRGLPRLTNGRLDLGAFEVQNPVVSSTPSSSTPSSSTLSALQELLLLAVDEFLLTIDNVLALAETSVGIAADPALAASMDALSNAINANPEDNTPLGDAVIASTFFTTMNRLAIDFGPGPG